MDALWASECKPVSLFCDGHQRCPSRLRWNRATHPHVAWIRGTVLSKQDANLEYLNCFDVNYCQQTVIRPASKGRYQDFSDRILSFSWLIWCRSLVGSSPLYPL